MAGGEIASAYLQIYPKLDGPTVADAVQKALSGLGITTGKEFGDEFEQGTKQRMPSAGADAGNAFADGFGTAAMVAIGTVVAEVATWAAQQFGVYFSAGISQSDALVKFASTMEFAGFSQSDIDAATAAIRDYADQTVYDLDEVLNTSAQLASNGVENYESLVEAAGNLNAAAGGNSESFGYLATAITQVNGAGRLMTQDWNQITNALPGSSGAIQDELLAMGAWDDSMGTFRDALANGEISAEEFNSAVMNLGLTDVAREAATSTETFEGATGQLEAAVTNTMQSIYDSLNEDGRITDAINGIASAFEAAAPVVATIADAFGDFVEFIAPAVPVVLAVVGAIAGVAALSGVISAVAGAVGFLTTVVIPAIGMIQSVPGLIAVVTTALGGPITVIAAVIAAIVAFVATNEDARNFVVNAFNVIKNAIGNALNWVKNLISNVAGTIRNVWNAAVQTIPRVVSNAVGNVRNAFSNMKSAITGFFSNAGSWLRNAGSQIIQGLVNGIRNAASWVTSAISNVCSNALGAVKSFFGIASPSKLMARMGGYMMSGLADGIEDGASAAVHAMEGASSSVAGAIGFGGRTTFATAGVGSRGTVNNFYIDGNMVAADATLAAALNTVAQRVSGRSRMGTVM